VDDEKRLVSLSSEYLQEAGYLVLSDNRSGEALVLTQSEKPDVSLQGIMMTEMKVLNMCRLI